MITVVVIAILATIAYPSYLEFVARGKRSAAQSAMMDIANRQQQYFLVNRGYANKTALEAFGYALPAEVASNYTYDMTVSAGPPPSFEIAFTATGSQASRLGDLKLDSTGKKTPADKW
jgi:type IV pilus assembly protein PilE